MEITNTLKVTFLNNDGGTGFAKNIDVEEDTTVEDFLESQDLDPARYQIRVRTVGEGGAKTTFTPTGDYQLKSGDFITAVPQKVGGAR